MATFISHSPEETAALGEEWGRQARAGWIFGLHDRPWPERPIYGKVRCMMASGLERKCDIGAYIRKVNRLMERAGVEVPKEERGRAAGSRPGANYRL